MNQEASRLLVYYGYITAEQRKKWMELSPHYVPLINEDTTSYSMRHATDRSTKAANPLEASIWRIGMCIKMGEQNLANRVVETFIERHDKNGAVMGGKQMV